MRVSASFAVALDIAYYNFVRIHSKPRMNAAMAAAVSDSLWEIGDMVKLVENAQPKSDPRGPHNKRIQKI